MTAAGRVCTAIKRAGAGAEGAAAGGHVAALPVRTLAEEEADFVAAGEGLHTLVGLVGSAEDAGAGPGEGARPVASRTTVGRASRRTGPWSRTSTTGCRRRPGTCCRWPATAPTTGTASTAATANRTPPSTRRSAVRYHCSFCCIQAPFRERRAGRRAARDRQQLSLLEPGHRPRRRSTCWSSATASATSRSPTKCSCSTAGTSSASATASSARKYDLNIWAYTRVDTIKDGMLDKLKAAGFTWLALGIEAGAERVRADVDKQLRPAAGL